MRRQTNQQRDNNVVKMWFYPVLDGVRLLSGACTLPLSFTGKHNQTQILSLKHSSTDLSKGLNAAETSNPHPPSSLPTPPLRRLKKLGPVARRAGEKPFDAACGGGAHKYAVTALSLVLLAQRNQVVLVNNAFPSAVLYPTYIERGVFLLHVIVDVGHPQGLHWRGTNAQQDLGSD